MLDNVKSVIFGCKGEVLTDAEKSFFEEQKPLGFILFARNCTSPEQVKRLIKEFKACVKHEPLILIDQEGGRVCRLTPPHWRPYPAVKNIRTLPAQHAKKATYALYRRIGEDLRELGINVNCAPTLDLKIAGANQIIGERSFSSDPEEVSLYGKLAAQALIETGVTPIIKHIPGHGRALVDSHLELPTISTPLEELLKTDFIPFKNLAHFPLAMTAHIVYKALDPQNPVTLSKSALNYIKEEIGYNGLLLTDDLSMKALKGSYAQRTERALEAGVDIILHCNGDMEEMEQIASSTNPLTPPIISWYLASFPLPIYPSKMNPKQLDENIEKISFN